MAQLWHVNEQPILENTEKTKKEILLNHSNHNNWVIF